MPLQFDENDIYRWFDSHTIDKAVPYLNAVSDVRVVDGRLLAAVRGRARQPYQVHIDLHASTRTSRSRLRGECSCPVGLNCKHQAATMMSLVDAADEAASAELTAGGRADHPRPELLEGLSHWLLQRTRPAKASSVAKRGMAFGLSAHEYQPAILLFPTRTTKTGGITQDKSVPLTPPMFLEPADHLTQQDITILCQLWLLQRSGYQSPQIDLAALLQMIVERGTGFIIPANGGLQVPARRGPLRQATLGWNDVDTHNGTLLGTHLQVEGDARGIVLSNAACYLDEGML